MTEPKPGIIILKFVGTLGLGAAAFFGVRSLIDQNAAVQSNLLNQQATLNAPGLVTPEVWTPTPTPVLPGVSTATPSPTETPKPQEWPTDAEAMYQQIYLKESDITDPAMLADIAAYRTAGVNVIEIKPGDLHKQLNTDGTFTGGWTLDPQRDPKRPPYFFNTVYLVRNSFGHMQYGYMPSDFRQKVGLTENEVAQLGWPWKDENHDGISDFVGSGVPANYAGLVEAITFYPLNSINPQDMPLGQLHELYRVLGPNMQTMDQRLARFALSSTKDSKSRGLVSKTDSIFGADDDIFASLRTAPGVTFIPDPNENRNAVSGRLHLGGGQPERITKVTNLTRQAQLYQHDPSRGIRRK